MARYKEPRCMAEDFEDPLRVCGVRMELAGERHPLWKPGFYTFICPRCESIRCVDELQLDRCVERA
jgi:hypothetical protein